MSSREIEDIARRIVRLREYIAQASEYSDMSLDAYLESGTIQDAIERRLQLCAESAIDIGRAILRYRHARPTSDYADVFRALADEGLLSTTLARQMQHVARYQNRLIHDHEDLDPRLVYRFRVGHLPDIVQYTDAVESWVAHERADDEQ